MTVATTTKDQEQVRQDSPLRPDWVIIIYMAALHIAALFALFPSNFSWAAVGVAVFFHWVTGGLGITLGFHRLVTHRSFQTPKWLEYFFVLCGTLSCQGGPINWIGIHRLHHLHSDENLDPHDSNKGFWWSHMGWMLYQNPADTDIPRVTKDISGDPVYQFLQKYFIPIQVVLGLILYALGGWPFVVWGIFVRIVAVFHCTWFVNSATHKFGYRTYESEDRSTNCWWVALLTYGEGWHNNHHAFQYSARHGLKWWEIDLTWMTIQFLQSLGLASKVKLVEESKQ
ncbi:acyl-CoA desaturase [Coleofasciculus sp. FACHB-64]|uniref:acyl-CoA desaturase n=1 Tax=Cyanophyceae TaxID=3028117 RepID=UPI0016890E74|nr:MULTISPECIES: acyl-CoA desaturase [unclassified Coleofasciculus]MBD1839452.1 acyl-CoA desaturase [Coleofasciculus sp. FACHB-501]MBD1902212.1 acyl-CoA desaturase [Coleofasciculus sp. FACHB-125]MBD2045229.1 acyl-CoA desaturase [Coleofasciculus sp. FACHB-64]MBD2083863.1 acyl-CoA desaturase [Coleofasciculus sp. FACHB-542]MBD2538806.1 acyl-CoA desaturase [Coleofasciculus sp. FACHB-SPT36]